MTDSKLQSWPSKDFFINCSNIIFLQKENLGNWLWIIYITANLHNIIFNGQLLGYMLVHLTIQSAYLSYFSAADNPLYGSFFFVHVLKYFYYQRAILCMFKQAVFKAFLLLALHSGLYEYSRQSYQLCCELLHFSVFT